MRELNEEFSKMAHGDMGFLCKYPLYVDPQDFGFIKGDKESFNPMTGATMQHRTNIGKTLMVTGTDANKDKYIHNKTVPVYADFNFHGKPSDASKMKVAPTMHLVRFGGHAVKTFYLPWKENKMHIMVIDEEADFFMTASMHGCRFEVKDFGSGQLSVSHTNVQPGSGKDAQQEVLKLIRGDSTLAPTALSFGKDKYFPDAQRVITATKRGLMPWGILPEHVLRADVDTYLANIVGVRSGEHWRFYYQLTCVVDAELHGQTTKKRYLGLFGSKKVDVKRVVKLDVVLKVAEIWPENTVLYVL
ncbi:MAG: hypothetical protein WC474_11220 [Hydrogenophilaceae bacterium]